ncbi:MAG: hypothetical protein ACFCVF_08880 [Kineosporiaceae bacterium]
MPTRDEPAPLTFTTDVWRTAAAGRWLAHADRLEATLEPILVPLLDHAARVPGERCTP